MKYFVNMILLGTAASSLFGLLLSLLVGALRPWIAVLSLLLGFASAWYLRDSREYKKPSYEFTQCLFYSFIVVACCLQFLYAFYPVKDQWWAVNTNNMGDLPLHVNMIKAFAKGLSFWPSNLEYVGQVLKYPFGMDFFNSLFESLGVPISAHLFLVGFIFSIASLYALHSWMGFWGVAAFFLSGGFSSWNELSVGNSWYPGDSVVWKNLFLAVFATQRGFLFALPAGIYLLQKASKIESLSRKEWVGFNLLIAVLPFFHLHSFFILSLYCFVVLLLQKQWHYFKYLIPGLVVAGMFILRALAGGMAQKTLGLMALWTWNGEESLLFYIFTNFATFLLPVAVLAFNAKKKLKAWLPIIFFILFLELKMAPWAWDNVKILLWCYLLVHKELFEMVLKQWDEGRLRIVACVLFLPGFLMLGRSFPSVVQKVQIFNESAIPELVTRQIPINDAVLAASEYNHPLYFTGNQMTLGFTGHLWSFGIDFRSRQNMIDRLLKGEMEWQEAAKVLDAKWLYWGETEKHKYGESPLWTKSFPKTCYGLDVKSVCLFDLRESH
jgi:hypothetical protein